METIKMMANFTEILKRNPEQSYDFISNNYHKMDERELVAIIKELLCAIYSDCYPSQVERILNDVSIELDEQYEEEYEELQHMKR